MFPQDTARLTRIGRLPMCLSSLPDYVRFIWTGKSNRDEKDRRPSIKSPFVESHMSIIFIIATEPLKRVIYLILSDSDIILWSLPAVGRDAYMSEDYYLD